MQTARKMTTKSALSVVVLIGVLASCNQDDSAGNPQTSAVSWHTQMGQFDRAGIVEGATAELVRYPEGMSFRMTTGDLVPGNAYTLWLVVINQPDSCEANPCRADEVIQIDEIRAQVGYADGHVAGGSRGTFGGSVPIGRLQGWLPDRSLVSPADAEVWLVLNDHGPVLDQFMPGMIDTYRGGCSDESPFPAIFPDTALADGEPGPNTCLLYQIAVFLSP